MGLHSIFASILNRRLISSGIIDGNSSREVPYDFTTGSGGRSALINIPYGARAEHGDVRSTGEHGDSHP